MHGPTNPEFKKRFIHFQYILGSQIVYKDGVVVTTLYAAIYIRVKTDINPLNAKLNPICHLLALLGAHHILHVSRIMVKMKFFYLRIMLAKIKVK
jgi:hypothetical protein